MTAVSHVVSYAFEFELYHVIHWFLERGGPIVTYCSNYLHAEWTTVLQPRLHSDVAANEWSDGSTLQEILWISISSTVLIGHL